MKLSNIAAILVLSGIAAFAAAAPQGQPGGDGHGNIGGSGVHGIQGQNHNHKQHMQNKGHHDSGRHVGPRFGEHDRGEHSGPMVRGPVPGGRFGPGMGGPRPEFRPPEFRNHDERRQHMAEHDNGRRVGPRFGGQGGTEHNDQMMRGPAPGGRFGPGIDGPRPEFRPPEFGSHDERRQYMAGHDNGRRVGPRFGGEDGAGHNTHEGRRPDIEKGENGRHVGPRFGDQAEHTER